MCQLSIISVIMTVMILISDDDEEFKSALILLDDVECVIELVERSRVDPEQSVSSFSIYIMRHEIEDTVTAASASCYILQTSLRTLLIVDSDIVRSELNERMKYEKQKYLFLIIVSALT
jgi:hypothetical protein